MEKNQLCNFGPKTDRYEMMWERDSSLVDEINLAWVGHDCAQNLQGIRQKLSATMSCLKSGSRLKFGAVTKEINRLKKDLEKL
jgi:hypothetical protein